MRMKIFSAALAAFLLLVFARGASAQYFPTDRLQRSCTASLAKAEVRIWPNGSITLTPCAGETVTIDGAVIGSDLLHGSPSLNAFSYGLGGHDVGFTSAATNGQILVGRTGLAPVKATLTPGANINVTNGGGSVAISVVDNPTFAGESTFQSFSQFNSAAFNGGVSFQADVDVVGTLTFPGFGNAAVSIDTDGHLARTGMTDGQLLIGCDHCAPIVSTLTKGDGIRIDNAPGAITISATGDPVNRRVYRASVSQAGTSDPTAVVIINSLGCTPVFQRDSGGAYNVTCAIDTPFPLAQTFAQIGQFGAGVSNSTLPWIAVTRVDDNTLQIQTRLIDVGVLSGTGPSDGLLLDTWFEIIVEP